MRTLHHFGIPVKEIKEGSTFNEGLKVWLTDIDASPNRIEFLKFEEGTCMPALIQELPHPAYLVPSIEEELKGKKVIFPITVCNEQLTIAFIEEEGLPVEIMELR